MCYNIPMNQKKEEKNKKHPEYRYMLIQYADTGKKFITRSAAEKPYFYSAKRTPENCPAWTGGNVKNITYKSSFRTNYSSANFFGAGTEEKNPS